MAVKYWNNGKPASDIDVVNDPGTTKYWNNGIPYGVIYEVISVGGNIKKYMSISWANIKKVNGVAVASIKKLMTIDA